MAKYLLSFSSAAIVVADGEWEAVCRDAHAVIEQAKAACVYVFAGEFDTMRPATLTCGFLLFALAAARCDANGFTEARLEDEGHTLTRGAPSWTRCAQDSRRE